MPWLPPEIALTVGVGLGASGDAENLHLDPVFEVRAAYRAYSNLALGLRARGSHTGFEYGDWVGGGPNELDTFELDTVDLGATLELDFGPYVMMMPWVGVHLATGIATYHSTTYGPNDEILDRYDDQAELSTGPMFAAGMVLGVHAYTHARYRVTIFTEVQGTRRGPLIDRGPIRTYEYQAVSLGTAVRF